MQSPALVPQGLQIAHLRIFCSVIPTTTAGDVLLLGFFLLVGLLAGDTRVGETESALAASHGGLLAPRGELIMAMRKRLFLSRRASSGPSAACFGGGCRVDTVASSGCGRSFCFCIVAEEGLQLVTLQPPLLQSKVQRGHNRLMEGCQ